MKIRNKLFILIFFIIIFIILLGNIVFARYYKKITNMQNSFSISEPIFKIENLSDYALFNEYNKYSGNKEYFFKVKNYELDGDVKRISEVNFFYTIKIINSNNYFPIRCELYDVDTNTLILRDAILTEKIFVAKDVEYEKNYKLSVVWDDEKEISGDMTNVNIEVNAYQSKT